MTAPDPDVADGLLDPAALLTPSGVEGAGIDPSRGGSVRAATLDDALAAHGNHPRAARAPLDVDVRVPERTLHGAVAHRKPVNLTELLCEA